jgi:hypothetical protein
MVHKIIVGPDFDADQLLNALPMASLYRSNHVPNGHVFVLKGDEKTPSVKFSRWNEMDGSLVYETPWVHARPGVTYTRVNTAAPFIEGGSPPGWYRQSGEGLTAWGMRLERGGLLDFPRIRWAYAKAVWSAIWRWPKRKR